MKKICLSLLTFLGFTLVFAACGKDEPQPVSIKETDTCALCNMAVANNEHATQILLESGKTLIFDDIGCMYNWIHEKGKGETITAKFVRDFNDKEWVSADDATYVYHSSLQTPMAYHVISFKEKASAEKFAEENEGSVLMTAEELANHKWEQSKEMMEGHDSHM